MSAGIPKTNSLNDAVANCDPNLIERTFARVCATPWEYLVVMAYGFLIPVVALHLPGVGGLGAADLLMPVGFFVLLAIRPTGKLQLPHIALAMFIFAACLSLLQIRELKPAVDCLIRWVRLFGIMIPFYFGLFMRVDNQLIKRAFGSWMVGGLVAILIGTFLHLFQIEVREGQQRLWMDGGSILRAGGLIGNSGAFGHMTATWSVISITYLMAVSKSRFRFLLVGGVVFFTLYVIFISSSRAAMLHLFSSAAVFIFLLRIPSVIRQWSVLGIAYGILGIIFLSCLMLCIGGGEGNGSSNSNAIESSLERFVPGYGGTDSGEFTSNRAENWPEYFALMNEKIFFGWGYKMGVRIHEESPDNSYLSVMLETGVVGFACMSFFVLGVFYCLLNRYYVGDPFACVMIAACVGQLFNCLTSDIYTFWITMPVVFMLLGLVIQNRETSELASQNTTQSQTPIA